MLTNLSMATASARPGQAAQPGEGPYGPLSSTPDENGLLLPDGFTSRIVGTSGDMVGSTSYQWPAFPDGAACFDDGEGDGWIYVCNSEVPGSLKPASGGVSAVRFDAEGQIVDAYRILDGSDTNCAGGPTPWGTWLSGEEFPGGQIWECDPTGADDAVAHGAMGVFQHEGAAVDPVGEAVYLTEDQGDGLLYRFTPDAYPDLSAGRLEAARVADDGAVTWVEVPDPSGASAATRAQAEGATAFAGGEGIWYHDGAIIFTTKRDHSVRRLDLAEQRHEVIWAGDPDGLGVEGAVLSHVDNVTVDAGSGDLYVAEDGGNMEVVVISAEGEVASFVRVLDHPASEITGPCFNPARDRLYFSSQRGPSNETIGDVIGMDLDVRAAGVTFEITGPFRGVGGDEPAEAPDPSTTLANAAPSESNENGGDDDGINPVVLGGVGLVAAGAVAGGVVAWRRRTAGSSAPSGTSGPGDDSPPTT